MGWDELRNKRFKRMKELGVIDRRAKLSPRDPDVPAWEEVGDKEWQERRMEVYAAQIDSMDQNIGRLVNCLKKSGRGDNAIVMFMIDNGGCHVEYETTRTGSFLNKTTRDGRPLVPGNIPGLMPGPEVTFQSYGRGWANASNTPYRLFKQYAHQGGIRNPLIIRWPDGIKKQLTGSFTDTTACMIDIMPTLLDVTETEHPAEKNKKYLPMDGKSFLGALYGKGLAERGAMLFKWAHGKAVVDGKWKIVIVDNGDWELYDLESDASELNDLASKHPGKVEQMEKLWIGQYGEVKPDKKNKSKEKEKK
jgi:arylsulfatase